MKQLTKAEVIEMADPEIREHLSALMERWQARGDGCAVYENQALDSSNAGHRKFVSFGSAQATLETDDPPRRLPDIGGSVHWMYQLVGTWR